MLRYRLINPYSLTALIFCCALGSGALAADQTLLKIDINASTNITYGTGDWTGWVISGNYSGLGDSSNGIQQHTFTNGIGVALRSAWFTTTTPVYIEGFTNSYWGSFGGDMAEVRDVVANQGDVLMTISYLAPGDYTLKTYHNPRVISPALNNLMDVNDKVGDGPWVRRIDNFEQTNWVPNNDIVLANPCTLNFTIPQPDTDYTVRYNTSFKVKTLTDPNVPDNWLRNVGICGFELISHAIRAAYGASPAPESRIRYNTTYNLSWLAPDPFTVGDTLHYDVYFATSSAALKDAGTGDPLFPAGNLLAGYTTATTLACPALTARTNYYWRVDTYGLQNGVEVKTVGALWHFDTNNQPPTLDLGPAQVSFPGRTISMSATSTDLDLLGKPDGAVITYKWQDRNDDVNDPNYKGRYGANINPFPTTTQSVSFVLDPNTTIVGTGRSYKFRCIASDGDKSTTVDINVFVAYETRCQLVKHLGDYYTKFKSPGDFNDDCITDLRDLSLYVSEWLGCKAVNNICQ
jgi:hypothetical protein